MQNIWVKLFHALSPTVNDKSNVCELCEERDCVKMAKSHQIMAGYKYKQPI